MYSFFERDAIQPLGWLKRQLEIQANGLSGNLDKIWPDVRDSAWIGGSCEGWERVPYWLDGFIPLAYLLHDEDKIARAGRYIMAILDRQQSDGWICPCTKEAREKYDVWALFLIGKVLALYCEFTGSARAEDGLYRAMRCLYDLMKEERIKLFNWGKFRWFECMIPLSHLYDQKPEEWILELARMLRARGVDYNDYAAEWERPLNKWTLQTHIVNLCMMLKYEAVSAKLLGEPCTDKAEQLWKRLEKYNGTAVGTFTGDECLSGIGNNHGTELCSVAELMYSCEWLYALTGKRVWAERLEKTAFNALPATISDDMWSHQYDQMVNQIACIKFPGKSAFRTNGADAHLFGLQPHFGCCTANFNQAWPKFVLQTFLKTKNGILVAHLLPTELRTEIKGVNVTVRIETEYPFRHSAKLYVKTAQSVKFALKIRIPSFAQSLSVNGQPVKKTPMLTLERTWSGAETVALSFTDTPQLVSRPFGLKTVEYGPLVFALPVKTEYRRLEYEKNGVIRKFPYCDYELIPRSEWRFGFADSSFTVCEKSGDDIPFSSLHPRLTLKARIARVDWDFADGFDTVAACCPRSSAARSEPIEAELYPYGCAKLRMTEMPLIKNTKKAKSR